jgi:hypothetical protein
VDNIFQPDNGRKLSGYSLPGIFSGIIYYYGMQEKAFINSKDYCR